MEFKKILASSLLAGSVILTGCSDKDSDNAKGYDLSSNLDKGNYDAVIRELGDCMSDDKNSSEETTCFNKLSDENKMNLGAAYMGKASYTLVDLGQELTSIADGDSNEVTRVIMTKLDNDYMSKGIESFKAILTDNNASICTEAIYPTLNQSEKQACISLNPILLKDLLDDDTVAGNESNVSITLEQIIDFKDVLKGAAPELSISEVVDIVNENQTTPISASNVNSNSLLDSIEATDCVIQGYNGSTSSSLDATVCSSANVTLVERDSDTYSSNSSLNSIKLVEVTVATSSPSEYSSSTFYRLVEQVNSSSYTTLATVNSAYCDSANEIVTTCTEVDIAGGCLPCVEVESGNAKTLNDSVVEVLNNESLLQSVAIAIDSESSLSESAKLGNFKTDLCGSSNCTVTQSDLLNYMK